MKSGLDVFDFNEEDEHAEIVNRKYLDKCKNPNLNHPVLKYEFLRHAASGASAQRKEANNVPCVDIETFDSDRSCDDVVQCQPMEARELEFGWKGGQSFSGDCPPTSSKQQVDKVGNYEPRTSPLELKLRDSGAEPPSPRISQSDCLPSNSESSEETFDVFLSSNRSLSECSPSSPTSDIAEDGSTADHCLRDIVLDDVHQAIAVNPDYISYQNSYWGGTVFFSGDGVKIKGSTPDGNLESFIFEREIDDIVQITCECVPKTGHVSVKVEVLSKDVKEAADSNSPGVEELNLIVFEPNWSEKQEAITSLNLKYLTIWHMNELDEDALLAHKPYFPNFDEHFEEVVYPKGDVDAVSISKRDVDLLQPDTFVNDTIIDFYIKYLKNQIPVEGRQRFHFFNSFFFRKLADLDKDPSSISDGRAAFLRVHKWTRKVDMFGKDYIFIPVNFNLHWSLIVLCHPGEVASFQDEVLDKSSKIPCILHMDSLRGSHDGLKNLVQSYLWEEWKIRHKESSEDLSSKFMNLRFISLELPQQENFYDCGLFLLHYLELFLTDAPDSFNPFKITKLSNFLNEDWFLPTEASLKRTLIQKLIFDLLEIRSMEITSTECIDNHQSAEIPETDEIGVQLITEECRPESVCCGDLLNARDTQGVGFSLLASSSTTNMQNVDSGLGFRQLIEQGVTAASFLRHFNSFNEPTFDDQNNYIPPEEEDAEAGEQNVYLASRDARYQLSPELTCSLPFSSGSIMLDGSSWNPGTLTVERDINRSPETSSTSADYDDDDDDADADVGIIESYGTVEKMINTENDGSDAQGHPLKEAERDIKDIAIPSTDFSEVITDAVPEKPDVLHFGNQNDGVFPSKTHERDETQINLDGTLAEPIEPSAKRIRFTFRRVDLEAVDVSTHKPEMIGGSTTKPCDGASTEFIEPIAEESAA